MEEFNKWIKTYTGTRIDIDSFPKGGVYQCVDYSQFFIQDFGGLAYKIMLKSGGAKDYFEDFPRSGVRPEWNAEKIPNEADNYPLAGDVVIYNASWGGGYGHVGIALDGCTSQKLIISEQNNGQGDGDGRNGDEVKTRTGNYTGVLGWIRIPKIHNKIYQNQQQIMYDKEKEKFYQIIERLQGAGIYNENFIKDTVKPRLDIDGIFRFTNDFPVDELIKQFNLNKEKESKIKELQNDIKALSDSPVLDSVNEIRLENEKLRKENEKLLIEKNTTKPIKKFQSWQKFGAACITAGLGALHILFTNNKKEK
jgi:CHAP domain